MKKRSILALIAALAVAAVGIFISFFLSFSEQDDTYTITLPGQGAAVIDPSPEVGESNHNKVQTISVTADNIQAVIASLRRPEQYQCQMETTYFYQDTQATVKSRVWRAGDLVRITQLNPEEQAGQQILLTKAWAYLWGEEGIASRFARQDKDLDLYSRAPAYEELVGMSPEQILAGELREVDGQLCLYAQTKDVITGETEQWYVLVESGLLLYAAGSLDGADTYTSQMTGLQLEAIADEVFLLPDGTKPE